MFVRQDATQASDIQTSQPNCRTNKSTGFFIITAKLCIYVEYW